MPDVIAVVDWMAWNLKSVSWVVGNGNGYCA